MDDRYAQAVPQEHCLAIKFSDLMSNMLPSEPIQWLVKDAKARFGTKTATADSSLIDDNTKKYT
jgi:hypothetical protein